MTTFDFDDDGSQRDEYGHLAVYVDPDALREEIIGGYFVTYEHLAAVREWALTLTPNDLAELGERMIQDDRLWDAFKEVVLDTVEEAYNAAVKEGRVVPSPEPAS